MRGYKTDNSKQVICYHCGEQCNAEPVKLDNKDFCCDGCRLVYDLLKDHNLCSYYNMNANPGSSPVVSSAKYDYLDNEIVSTRLIRFNDGNFTHITFFIPEIHCSSCIWLLENFNRLNSGVISSSVNFLRKEASIVFNSQQVKLSEVVSLLAHIGYEPLINLNDLEKKSEKKLNTNEVLKIGIAGFCFGNIMMLSFPEYFSLGNFQTESNLSHFFGYLNLLLSLPVFFYCASGFFVSAWKSIRYRFLNIDAPIALAILVTFSRSIYEITTHSGAGYMDSMSGIVFFMLTGRYLQNRTYQTLSFERDYKSYFPVGVTVLSENGTEINQPVSTLKKGDRIIIRNNELIPADSCLISTQTHVDYSFITGESAPVNKIHGELIYAGARQTGGAIELEVIKSTSQSYLTQLWNRDTHDQQIQRSKNYIDNINKYFTAAVLSISMTAGLYWLFTDSSKVLNAVTAVLIVACPCGLLLISTFVSGNLMRIFGRNKFYLKNASVIEKLMNTDTIIFDKTGTITQGSETEFYGPELRSDDLQRVTSLAAQSSHPLSRKIHAEYSSCKSSSVSNYQETTGYGISGCIEGKQIELGSEEFVTRIKSGESESAKVYLKIENEIIGYFRFRNSYRTGLKEIIGKLSQKFSMKVLSGDNDAERKTLQSIFGNGVELHFNQKPDEKMQHIMKLQEHGHKVMMIGDGLNDAGALRQSDIGIAVSDDTNNFSPACDAILDGRSFVLIPSFINLAKSGKRVVIFTFIISIAYNIIGLLYAVQGILSPVIAAVLMPVSSVTIVVITTVLTNLAARLNKL